MGDTQMLIGRGLREGRGAFAEKVPGSQLPNHQWVGKNRWLPGNLLLSTLQSLSNHSHSSLRSKRPPLAPTAQRHLSGIGLGALQLNLKGYTIESSHASSSRLATGAMSTRPSACHVIMGEKDAPPGMKVLLSAPSLLRLAGPVWAEFWRATEAGNASHHLPG